MNLLIEILQWTVVAVLLPIFVWVAIQITKVMLKLTLIAVKAIMNISIEVIKLAFAIIIDMLSSGIKALA